MPKGKSSKEFWATASEEEKAAFLDKLHKAASKAKHREHYEKICRENREYREKEHREMVQTITSAIKIAEELFGDEGNN